MNTLPTVVKQFLFKMVSDTVIAALFDLPIAYEPLCDADSCKSVVGHLSKFCKHLVENETMHPWITKSELKAFESASASIDPQGKPFATVEWLPGYGSAVMKSVYGCSSGEVTLNLIALDQHRFQTTSKLSASGYDYVDTAFATDFEVLHIGICTLDQLPTVDDAFRRLLSSAQAKTGDARSARGGKQGHQRTPAFIHALYRQVFGSGEELPRGGMTDVGLHTGGKQRSTAGPLVFSILRQILQDLEAKCDASFLSESLFKKILSYFGLHASEMMLESYDDKGEKFPKSNAPDILLEHAFHILRMASIKAAAASDDGIDMSFFVEWSKDLRQGIMSRANEASAKFSGQFKLPQTDADIYGCIESFSFNLPPACPISNNSQMSVFAMYNDESKNLAWLPVIDQKGLKEIHEWLKKSISLAKQDAILSILLLKAVEELFWDYAKKLPVMEEDELAMLAHAVDNYREVLNNFKVNRMYSSLSLVQLNSREVLVVWVAFCVIHFNAARLYDAEMQGFGVSLDFNYLSHLVLSEKEEWEVAKQVALYLNKYGTSRPLFSLKEEGPTFDMGRRVANKSSEMLNVWEEENQDAKLRIEGHWQKVLRKQEEARKLRVEIAQFEEEKTEANRKLAPLKIDLAEHERKHRNRRHYDYHAHQDCITQVGALTRTVSYLDSTLVSRNAQLQSALRAPPPVIQPLPKEKNSAMPIIFFLYMPPIFQLLSRFSCTAQQLLIPKPWASVWGGREGSEKYDITNLVTRQNNTYCQLSLTDHYNAHQESQYHQPCRSRVGTDYHILLRAHSNCIPEQIGSSNVDYMKDKNNGIWYPDELRPRMAWFGGTMSFDKAPHGCEINPFVTLDHFYLVAHFTERLPNNDKLRWSMIQPGDNYIHSTRGNLPYARPDKRPCWLSKTEYISFANLRSHPNIQLRNIFVAIHERQLPFNELCVHTLINQSLFHLGDFSVTKGSITLEWKRDLDDSRFCNDACNILETFYQAIRDTPKNYLCVKFLGRLCNFLSGWALSCRSVARQLAVSVFDWAEDVGRELEKSPPSLATEIRAKQVVLYQHSLMVLAGGQLIESDVGMLIEMLVKSRNLFTGGQRDDEIRQNQLEISYALGERLDHIVQTALSSPSVMTNALRSFLPRCPSTLIWKRWVASDHSTTQCFGSLGSDGQSYAINLITGDVLINGLPPSRLPLSVLQHQLYKRTFGECQFEVVQKNGFLETCRPTFGRFYRFTLGTSLKVYELKEDETEMLELLDVRNGASEWSKNIPPRLTNMHSHWLQRDKKLIVLRAISFNDRKISYLVKLESYDGTSAKGQVKQVELHREDRDQLSVLIQDLDSMDTLVLHHSPVLDIISKFEPKQYIHSLISAAGTGKLKFYLPRFKMTFELREGVLHCQEVSGYQLMIHQQTDETLRGVKTYLLLENSRGGREKIILFPEGQIRRKSHELVDITVPSDCDAELLWYQYEFHPRFKFIETKQSRSARMQLVALHIATTSLLPDELLGMTGEERAITMIRQCWGNRPLDNKEHLALENIKQLSCGRSPTLSILCQDIMKSSQQFPFLYSNFSGGVLCDNTQCFEGSAYLNNVKSHKIGSRCYLTKREEARVIGIQARRPSLPPWFRTSQILSQNQIDKKAIEILEKRLDQLCVDSIHSIKMRQRRRDRLFPLRIDPASKLEADMMNELKESWDAYQGSISHHIPRTSVNLDEAKTVQSDIIKMRQSVEMHALNALNEVSSNECHHWHNNAHEILRIVGLVPTGTILDLAKIAIDHSLIKLFNPMINDESCERLVESILVWLQLCVHEDKFKRIMTLHDSGAISDVVKELRTKTVWDKFKYPYWLVFEVEQGLTIRQDQYMVAKHLIENPGHIIQLNMGLGKTRVILPMLVLYFSFAKSSAKGHHRDKITRLNFLSALYEEAYRYLQNHLTASILGVNVYTMPFCRELQLDLAAIERIKNAMDNCCAEGGALVVAPEHRLSLELKAKELSRSGDKEIANQIESLIRADNWRDILDECDEILRHRYQLIYAIGTPVSLPSGGHRWTAVQAIFDALAHNDKLKHYMRKHREACNFVTKSREQWSELQFFDGQSLDIMLGDDCDSFSNRPGDGLLSMLTDVILSNPPHELQWMLDHPRAQEIKNAIIEKEYPPELENLHEHHRSDVLALRGLIAGGVLRHCLLKRHRVNFGVARPGKKRLAVPFRFADTPDRRSEFAHPDCAIAFTVLAYYHDGLSKDEFMEALKTLLMLGGNAQQNFYKRWLEISSDQMEKKGQDVSASIDLIEKIDLTNVTQMATMYNVFHKNMRAIDFYLNNCVFPHETDQFDSRLTATAWNLAQNHSNSIVGFSGTNDNWRILPLQIKQYFASTDEKADLILKNLDGTNGNMLETITLNTLKVVQLVAETAPSNALMELIRKGIKRSINAIIDCGALLAGVDLQETSKSILSLLPHGEFGGVLYYDSDKHHDWVVLEKSGRILPKDISPITEKNAFVIFDEPRCRGTDLKLQADAVALLTLAPNVCKDKLMQSAGRLRKLGQDQKLIMVGGADVFAQFSEMKKHRSKWTATTATDVLSWSMKNTVESTSAGLLNWANQAFFFTTTFGKDPLLSVTDEVLELQDMYGKSFTNQTITSSTNNAYIYHIKRTGGEDVIHSSVRAMVELVNTRINEYGSDFKFAVRGCDEECERELEMEVEEEEEAEIEVPSVEPIPEKKWKFESVFTCNTPKKLPITVYSLASFVETSRLSSSSVGINWAKDIYTTSNFANTIVRSSESSLSKYLRTVNFLLHFPDESILLLSEFEANQILSLFWKLDHSSNDATHHLLHTSFLRQSLDKSTKILFHCTTARGATVTQGLFRARLPVAKTLINEESMSSLQLFSGETIFATNLRKCALKSLLRVSRKISDHEFCPLTAARHLVEIRGNGKLFHYSDLESICQQLLCEL
ncbi:hypothetical protein HJC23_013664 [Cyclotella cryptica]|uniref:ubiquitinyl hydrolase 1 n=1 Tax=Cyclotella cryptica TaxID=29204 RepID=A0ABD3QUU4_9STRA|eukprot:CCRYP_001504-RA/>CCRYP_001504-RA protein AED:0.02 eAED:0.02 QI:1620/1/1/1/1/0.88/9/181/2921